MRETVRDLIRGGHYGQRSREPHKQAEHMAAPTKAAKWRKSLPTRSRPHMGVRSSNLFGRATFLHFPCVSQGNHTLRCKQMQCAAFDENVPSSSNKSTN